jgi:hypothetical protein
MGQLVGKLMQGERLHYHFDGPQRVKSGRSQHN